MSLAFLKHSPSRLAFLKNGQDETAIQSFLRDKDPLVSSCLKN